MASLSPYLGIDFGTSKCTMAWFNSDTGRAEVLRNAEGRDETPSLVYIGEEEVLVGESARDALDLAEQSVGVILSVKSDLRRKIRYPVPGRPTPVEVSAHILRKMRLDAREGHFHAEVTRVAITCPASFDPVERERLLEAAHLAGFTDVALLDEPVSAALAYAQAGYRVGSHVLVYDLGAGTFDAALLVRENDGSYRLGLPPAGLRCGGDDFDRALYDHCDVLAQEQFGHPLGRDGDLDLRFLFECRKRKENLTIRDKCHFSSLIQGLEGQPKQFRHQVERATFEELITPTLEPTVRLTRTLLEQAAHQNIAVDSVILVGGSSRIPLAARMLRETLPVEPQRWEKQDIAVALGAALYARDHFAGPTEAMASGHRVPLPSEVMAGPPASLAPAFWNVLPSVSTRTVAGCLQGGEAAISQGDFTKALADFEEAYQKAPHDPNTLTGIGRASLGLGDTMAAVLAFQKAVRLAPDAPGAVHLLGETQLRGGLAAQAVTTLEPLSHTPRDIAFHVLFGHALSATGRYGEAIDQFLFALTLDPSADDAFLALQSLLTQPHRRTQALAQAGQRQAPPLSPRERLSLGFSLAARDFVTAAHHLQQCVLANYSLSIAYYGLGEAAVAAGKIDVAMTHFGNAYQQDSRNRRALFRAGCVASEARQSHLAVEQFSRLADIAPEYPEVYLKLGQAFVALREYDQGLVELREAARQQPDTLGIGDLMALVEERRQAEAVIAEVPAQWRGQSGLLTVTRLRLWFTPKELPRPAGGSIDGVGARFAHMAKTAYHAIHEAMNKGIELPVNRILLFEPVPALIGQDESLLIHLAYGEKHLFQIGQGCAGLLQAMQGQFPEAKFGLSSASPLSSAESGEGALDDA